MTPRERCISEFEQYVDRIGPKHWGTLSFELHFVAGELKHWNITHKVSHKYKGQTTEAKTVEPKPSGLNDGVENGDTASPQESQRGE